MNAPVNEIMESIRNIFGIVKDIAYKVVLFPFKLWFSLPWYVNVILFVIIFIIVFSLAKFFYKNKDVFDVYV